MELKEQDFKIISYLYHNDREPVSKIAKSCKLTRDQVEYKLNKYISSGLIVKFHTIFNYKKLGYDCYAIILIKANHESLKELELTLEKNKNLITYGKIYGKFDLFLECIFKDENELSEYVSNLITNYNISDYIVIKPYFGELYPLKFFKAINRNNFPLINEPESILKLDEKEKLILKALEKDGRMKIIDIAKETKMSSELILYKLKKLQKEKVILGSKIQIDLKKLGYSFSALLMNIHGLSNSNKEKLKKFTRDSKNIISIALSVTQPNCIIQLFHKDNQDIKVVVIKLKEMFKENELNIDLVLIDQEEYINTLPFF